MIALTIFGVLIFLRITNINGRNVFVTTYAIIKGANAEKRLSKLSPEQLKAVIANPKSSNVEVKVAKHLLGL